MEIELVPMLDNDLGNVQYNVLVHVTVAPWNEETITPDLIWNNKFQTQQTLKYEKGNNSIHPATGNSDRVYKKRKQLDDCETTLYFSYR